MKTDSTELRGKASSQDQQDRRIAAILGNAETPVTDKTLRRYLKYIKSKLTLPCDVNGMNHERGRKFRLYEVNFDTRDEMYGLIGLAKGLRDRCTYHIPLCDLEAADKTSDSHKLLEDYSVWFVNNR